MGSLDKDVKNQLKEVNEGLISIDDFYGNLEGQDYEALTKKMTPLEKAQFDVTISYAYNSLYWMYLRSMGEDLKEHKVKEELDRIKSQMQRLQQIKDKSKRPKVNTEAAGRMIRHGISHSAKNKKKRKIEEEENWDNEEQEASDSKMASTSKS